MTHRFTSRQKMHADTFEIYHYSDNALDEVSLHHHDFYELYFFLSGNVNYVIGGRNYQLLPGDLLLISPLELHQPRITAERHPYERIVLWVSPKFLESLSSQSTSLTRMFDVSNPKHVNLLRLTPEYRKTIRFYLDRLLAEREQSQENSHVFSSCQLLCLLVELDRIVETGAMRGELETMSKSERLITEVVRYIDDNYDQPISLESLSQQFFFSKYHLSHEFNRLLGTSIYKYIVQRRLLIACQLLDSGLPPSDVYRNCGFGDYANFYRAFRAEYAVSPREYMQNRKQGEEQSAFSAVKGSIILQQSGKD